MTPWEWDLGVVDCEDVVGVMPGLYFVRWEYLGEGNTDSYNPDDPGDYPHLQATLWEKIMGGDAQRVPGGTFKTFVDARRATVSSLTALSQVLFDSWNFFSPNLMAQWVQTTREDSVLEFHDGQTPPHRSHSTADEELSQDELDELVHEAKADEAAEINNQGRDAQIAYLTERGVLSGPSKEGE